MKINERVPHTSGSVEIGIDEGGVRLAWRSTLGSPHHGYVPLREIADVDVDESFLGGVRLVLKGTDGGELRIDAANASCVAIQGVLLVALEDQRRSVDKGARDVLADLSSVLARGDDGGDHGPTRRSITDWLGDVARHATGSYRDVAFDRGDLLHVLADSHCDVEARAAAAYALLTSGDNEHLTHLTRVFITHALPPIVLAVACAAEGGAALVPDHVIADVEPYLVEADVSALRAMQRAASNPTREAEVTAALDKAKEEVAEEAKKEHDATAAQAQKWRRVHTASFGADTRWVGKTWAL